MQKPRTIILLIADSLRFDSVYQTGINLPYLEARATQFTQARAAGCWTLPGTASLFTGLLPHEHGATSQTRKIHDHIPTLAEKLKAAGYNTAQVTANVVTTDIFGIDRGFDETRRIWKLVDAKFNKLQQFLVLFGKPRLRRMLMSKDALMHRMSADLEANKSWLQHTHLDIFNEVRQIVAENERQNRPGFVFVNLMESHFPYHIAPEFQFLNKGVISKLKEMRTMFHALNQTFLTREKNPLSQQWLDVLKLRQQIAWRSLASNIDGFAREMHEHKDTLFVFAADHGDNFGDQDWVYHFSNVTDAGTKVPLFWLPPHADAGRTIDEPVSSRNIHHAILKAAGLNTDQPALDANPGESLSVMQSYWYNNHGKTLPRYLFNQFCFVEGETRFLYRQGQWFSAPVTATNDTHEVDFTALPTGADPIEDALFDAERKQRLRKWLTDFDHFSEKVLPR